MYEVIVTDFFEKNLKYYKKKLSKPGYKELESKLENIYDDLQQGKFDGDTVYASKDSMDKAIKLRIGIKKMNLGQSNGMRCIYYVVNEDNEVYIITIYMKADMDPSSSELKSVIEKVISDYM